MSFLEAHNLCKIFKHDSHDVEAVSDVSLSVGAGEIVAVVGPSGCGKTTLLRLLAGLEPLSGGSISLSEPSPGKAMTHAFVFQKPLLFQWRTVLENTYLFSQLNGRQICEGDVIRAKSILASLGLSGFEQARPNQLSGGMAQRVNLARALFTNPRLLFLDEPLSAVDELARERLWVDFRRVWRERNISAVLVTHSIREAVFLGDKVLVMSPRPGRVTAAISIRLPAERNSTVLYDHAFQEICAQIRQALELPPKDHDKQ